MNSQRPNPELAALPDLFLLNPQNRPFIEGKASVLASEPSIRSIIKRWLVLVATMYFFSGNAYGGGHFEWPTQILLSILGETTQGSIIIHRWEDCPDSPNPSNYLTYLFTASDDSLQGERVTVEQPVTSDTCERLRDGSAVTVRYLPFDPHIARLAGADADNLQRDVETRNTMLAVAALPIIFIGGTRAMRRNQRLKLEGQLLNGWIIRSEKRGIISRRIWLRYVVITPDGEEHQLTDQIAQPEGRKSSPFKRHSRVLPEPGTPIAVLYVNDHLHEVL